MALRSRSSVISAGVCAAGLLLQPCLLARPGFARQAPELRIPLEPLDYQAMPESVLTSGAALLTLHYVDDRHLLLTFARRRLMARIPGDPPTDVDRNVDALLLELPSGKVLARTNWRLHDPGRYLWRMSDGQFLLRIRDRLTTFAPLTGTDPETAFTQHPFIASERPIGAVLVSPAADLLTLETLDHSPYVEEARQPSPGTRAYAAATAAAAAGDAAAEPATAPVQIDFFRVGRGASVTELRAEKAGTFAARSMVLLPVDGAGYLAALDQGKAHWAFDFHRHDGAVDELSPFDSTCRPMPFMVSRSEFIAFGCRGGSDRREIGGFNLRGEEMWEQTYTDSFTRPTLAFAPAAGRFALGRLIVSAPTGEEPTGNETLTGENIAVYQTETGRQLLSLNATPVLRSPQNFDLSPDGQWLAVVNGGAIEIYPLPPPSPKEREAVHLADSLIPQGTDRPIRLATLISKRPEEQVGVATAKPVSAGKPTAEKEPRAVAAADRSGETAAAAAESSGGAGAVAPAAAQRTIQLGDAPVDTGERRKAPTLYEPGEKHDQTAGAASR